MMEQPFVPIFRALRQGKEASRKLTQEKARRAKGMNPAGEA
jgi:hypothetical protein